MGGKKNTASKSNGGVKIVELGTELRVDPRQIVAAAKEMAMENAKVPASWVTAGQADRLRAKFGGNRDLKAKIERKLKYAESAFETPTAAPKEAASPTVQTVKLGKKTFESDRRAIFGVVAKAGSIPVDQPVAPVNTPSPKTSEPVSEWVASPSVPTADKSTPNTLETPASPVTEFEKPAKKFIQINVAPPIRRDASMPDPRFGVIVPVAEPAKKDASTAIWGNLKDGSPLLEAATLKAEVSRGTPPNSSEPVDINVAEVVKPAPLPHAPVKKPAETGSQPPAHAKKPQRKSAVSERHEAVAPSAEPAAAIVSATTSASGDSAARQRVIDDVPVKWQPKHKAFGAKVKLKAKILKKLENNASGRHSAPKSKADAREKHDLKRSAKHHAEPAEFHATPEHKAHAPTQKEESKRKVAQANEKSEGVLTRLIRRIFKS